MAFPLGSIGAGFFHGLTNNIEEARKGQTERAKLLGQLMGLGPELPEDIRSQIAPFTQPESRMSEVMGGLGLTSAPREDLNRLTGLAARAQGYLSSIPLQKERMAGENLTALLNPATTPTDFKFSMPDETNPLPNEGRPLALAPPPKVDLTQTSQGPDIPQHLRQYLGLEAKVDPLAGLKTYGQYVLREPRVPLKARAGEAIQLPDGTWTVPNPAKPESLFAKPKHPTEGKTAESIVRWRATVTPENPYGDQNILEDKPASPLDTARLAEIKARTENIQRQLTPESLTTMPLDRLQLNRLRAIKDSNDLAGMSNLTEEEKGFFDSRLRAELRLYTDEIRTRQRSKAGQPSPLPATPTPTQPGSGGTNRIRVREKASGSTGTIPENEFDPAKYDRIQ